MRLKLAEKKRLDITEELKLNVPILDASPHVLECKVTKSFEVGNTIIFISETACIHADSRYVHPCPESDNLYTWYESQDAKNLNPLLYAFKYYTLGESIGQLNIKDW